MTRSSPSTAAGETDVAAVSWRDGVHIAGTSIWCDARRARDVCFVSSADAVGGARHGQLIATAETMALLAREDGRAFADSKLAAPFGRPFTLGTRRLELFASGHAVGSASLLVEVDGRRVVYAGRVNPRGGGLAGAADLRACDALVVAAEYGDPSIDFAPVDRVAEQVIDHARQIVAADRVAVLLVSSPLAGLDVAARLQAAGIPTFGHRAVNGAARRLAAAGFDAPAIRRWPGRARGGAALIWPSRNRQVLGAGQLPAGSSIALLSGAARHPETLAALGVDVAFAWADQADFATLLEYIEATGATEVYLTHRFAETMANAVAERGVRAHPLGPPQQMSLF